MAYRGQKRSDYTNLVGANIGEPEIDMYLLMLLTAGVNNASLR